MSGTGVEPPRDEPARDRFTLLDAMILVAAIALGLMALRLARAERYTGPNAPRGPAVWIAAREAAPVLDSLVLALLICQGIRRPIVRRRFGSPGLIACAALLLVELVQSLMLLARGHLRWLNGRTVYFPLDTYWMAPAFEGGWVVGAAWLALCLSGSWHPVPSWIDRAGRAIGVLVIITRLGIGLDL